MNVCDNIKDWQFWLVVGSIMLPCGYALHIVAISKLVHLMLLHLWVGALDSVEFLGCALGISAFISSCSRYCCIYELMHSIGPYMSKLLLPSQLWYGECVWWMRLIEGHLYWMWMLPPWVGIFGLLWGIPCWHKKKKLILFHVLSGCTW